MINLIFDKNKFLKILLIISFFSCWSSISTDTSDIIKIFQLYKIYLNNYEIIFLPTFSEVINSLRQLIIFILFPILLIFNFLEFNKKNFRENFPFFCLFLYFILQIPGLILTQNSYLNIGYVISALNILLILNLTNKISDIKTLKIFIYLSLFFFNSYNLSK